MCGGDTSRSIRVQCLDWDKTSAPDLIGEFYTSLAEMSQAAEGKKVCMHINFIQRYFQCPTCEFKMRF